MFLFHSLFLLIALLFHLLSRHSTYFPTFNFSSFFDTWSSSLLYWVFVTCWFLDFFNRRIERRRKRETENKGKRQDIVVKHREIRRNIETNYAWAMQQRTVRKKTWIFPNGQRDRSGKRKKSDDARITGRFQRKFYNDLFGTSSWMYSSATKGGAIDQNLRLDDFGQITPG